jgi:ATP-dependent DNA helicase RecG
MEAIELLQIIRRGEDSRHQFGADVTNQRSLATELVAFSNSGGGRLFIGVSNDGALAGLTRQDMDRLNQLGL